MLDNNTGYKSLLKGRRSVPHRTYLITACCHGRLKILNDAEAARIVEGAFTVSDEAGWTTTFAYVVMPDHFHWLFRLASTLSLSQVIRRTKGLSSHHIGKRLPVSKPVWQAGFHDNAIREHESIEAYAEYILMNPVRAGLVDDPVVYPFKKSIWLNRG